MGLDINELFVANYMTPYPHKASLSAYFDDVVDFMTNYGIGNLIIVETKKPIGILTERELIQCAISYPNDLKEKQVRDIGYQKFISIDTNTSILKAAKLMIKNKSRLLVFDNSKLVGIITASDMLRAFRKTDETPSLERVLSKKIYFCSTEDSILKAIKIMYQKKLGSVIVKNKSLGIFTERDLLTNVLTNNVDLEMPVKGYCTYPLITAKYGISANQAADMMAENRIKRLGLIKNNSLAAIVTARDIVDAYQSTYPTSDPYLENN